MTTVLWDDEKSPHPTQRGRIKMLVEEDTEIGKRINKRNSELRLLVQSLALSSHRTYF